MTAATQGRGLMVWVRRGGLLLSLISCGWVGWSLWQRSGGVGSIDLMRLIPVLVGGSLGVVVMNALLGVAWREWVRLVGGEIDVGASVGLAWQVQIAKYLPGNVFQYAGRVVEAERRGVPRRIATAATAAEPFAMAGLAMLVSIGWWGGLLGWGWTMALVVTGGAVVAGGLWWGRDRIPAMQSPGQVARSLVVVTLAVLGMFAVQTLVFAACLALEPVAAQRSTWEMVEMVIFSWAMGFIAIGAPAGMGVREVVLLAFAASSADGQALLVAGVWSRACSVLGDVLSLVLSRLQSVKVGSSSRPK